MRNYTLKQLQTFIEVAREKSVSKAAERLFVTQPAVSMQIRQLEEAFGLSLIEPVGRNIQLTHAGHEFLNHAIAAVSRLKDLEASMAEHVGMKKGRIELAVVSTAKYFVPMLLVRFAQLLPGIEVKLRIDNRENILGMLSRSEIDLVIMGRAPNTLDCEATPFATNPLGIVCAPDHPLARRKRLSIDAVKDYEFVVREQGSGTRAAMERLFAQHDLPLKVAMEMPSNETIKQAVMAGMGLSFLSLRTVRHELAGGHMALVDIGGMPIMGKWYVTHLTQKKLSPAAKSFKEFLIEQGGPLIDSWA
ncbi:MAG: LysR family transcriptional regulator [Curvibacter sp. GWA2_64_110]|nr:MAG: LysR family transcriptional regulator [Curvibacter sp. GWA2_64_110]HCY17276.1 LysR family transcriptional regulator [Curvibacter sp.]